MSQSAKAFIVEPYLKAATVRSPLGFMSQATRWAQLLFPGITVLTRNFLHVELLHRELRSRKRVGTPDEAIERALRTPTLHQRLEHEYRRRMGDKEDATVAKMTYWQRYGSLFEYFGLWNAPHALRREQLWPVVFRYRMPEDCCSWVKPEPREDRLRRIRHTRWYIRFREELLTEDAQIPPRLLWWITGERGPHEVSEEIRLSRRLSYAFLIWQTIFELGIKLRLGGHSLPRASNRPVTPQESVDLLVQSSDKELGSDDLRKVYAGLLSAHTHQLRSGMSAWQVRVERTYSDQRLMTLYDGTSAGDFAGIPAPALFSRLVRLHQHYCAQQGKTDAEYVRPVGDSFRPLRFAKVTASFQAPPWGLFGYRLEQAAALYQSGR